MGNERNGISVKLLWGALVVVGTVSAWALSSWSNYVNSNITFLQAAVSATSTNIAIIQKDIESIKEKLP